MSAHTPGPFEKGPELGGVTERTFPCAVCGGVSTMRGCSLHAAAPELLEALEAAVKALENIPTSWGAAFEVDKARAAIAKAKSQKETER